jgi:hypothetical protein
VLCSEAEAEVQRIKLSVIKTEEERLAMERKAREAELLVSRYLIVTLQYLGFWVWVLLPFFVVLDKCLTSETLGSVCS